MRGQMSAEMLILIVVVLAIVSIAAGQLIGTAKDTSEGIKNQTKDLNELTAQAMKGQEGDFCIDPDDCMDGLSCPDHRCE
ncbi:MAG: hypothetical protein AB1324_03175 [Candidatus Micrarchaeota archaeon]